jgi:4-amino-4-deoxy-L-arabinose transferase-like glycosyltransferase
MACGQRLFHETMEPMNRRQPFTARAAWGGLALLPLLLGFALRLSYVLQAEPFVDEPTTLLVAQSIAHSGVPVLPSGLFYGNDLPFSYLAGGLVALFGPRLEVLRLFSLAASLLTVVLVYRAGRRLLSPWAGLWAALLLALSPDAIVWGGRARAYVLLALLAFLAVWLFYAGLAAERSRLRRLGWLTLVIAVFVHPEAALLLPAFVLGAGLLLGWRWWLRPARLAEVVLAAAAVGARYWLQLALARGQIGGFKTLTGSRPPLELAGDWLSRLRDVLPFFLDPSRLLWTLLALLALAVAVWLMAAKRQAEASRPVLFLSVCLWLVPAEMVLLLGSTYQSPRYLTMLLPLFALLAGYGLDWTLNRLAEFAPPGRRRLSFGLLAGLVTAVLVAASWPGAVAAANSPEKAFRTALEYVGQHWQPGDRVATVAPAYSQLVLGRSDFFTLGLEYEEFVYRADDGQWVDRWLGSPLIRSAEELATVLDQAGRLWFVTDETRLRQRFDPAFAQMVWKRMELVAKPDQVMVFLSRDLPEPAASHSVAATFGGQVALLRYDLGLSTQRPAGVGWGEVAVEPGQALPLTLYWQATAPITAESTVFIHLVGADGQRYAQDDGPPLKGIQPMTHWPVGEILPDRRSLDLPASPAAMPPGRYRLDVGLYAAGSGERLPVVGAAGHALGQALSLDFVQVLPLAGMLPSPAQPMQVDFVGNGDQIRLLGYTLGPDRATTGVAPPAAAGTPLVVTFYWQALAPVSTDYTVFVHLLDGADQIRGQGDGPPAGGFYLSSFWDPGEIIVDEHQVSPDADAPAGTYRLAVGLYVLSTGRRLSTAQGDRVVLSEVEVR